MPLSLVTDCPLSKTLQLLRCIAQMAQDFWAIIATHDTENEKAKSSHQSHEDREGRVKKRMIFVTWPRDLAGAMLW